MPNVLIEVCVDSLEGAIAAETAGADRLELNLALELDGLTPSAGLAQSVLDSVSVPVIAMIRPRSGDFCYSQSEWSVMLKDAACLLEMGVSGIAFGAVFDDGRLDSGRCQEIIATARGCVGSAEIVFHKAFDVLADWRTDVATLVELGVQRVMTSGRQPDSLAGLNEIIKIQASCQGQIGVLPAGGVTSKNVVQIAQKAGVAEIHGSFSGGEPGDFPAIQAEIRKSIARLAIGIEN